jgi:pimeloyl-ACP methyl ester carboxylesterase
MALPSLTSAAEKAHPSCWSTARTPTSAAGKPVLPAFEEHFSVYAIDRRGRGGSGDSQNYSIEREFEDVAAVVDSIGELVNLLGHSMGAVCSLEAALLTSNVRTLVLEGGDSSASFKTANKAVDEALPNCRIIVMPGQGHAAMDTGTELFTTEVFRSLTAD